MSNVVTMFMCMCACLMRGSTFSKCTRVIHGPVDVKVDLTVIQHVIRVMNADDIMHQA